MATLRGYITVELVDSLADYNDPEEMETFMDNVLTDLILHSNWIGDQISESVKLQDVIINAKEDTTV